MTAVAVLFALIGAAAIVLGCVFAGRAVEKGRYGDAGMWVGLVLVSVVGKLS